MIKNGLTENLTYSDYRNLYRSLKIKKTHFKKQLKVAILPSFTAQGLDEILFVKCFQQEIGTKIYIAPYNQYPQEIINSKSKLYEFNPDLIILMIDPISFLGDYWLNPYQLSIAKRKKFIKLKFEEIKKLLLKLRRNSKAKIIIHNFNIPYHSPLGILENKQQFSFQDSIKQFNENLQKMGITDPNLFVFDYDGFCSKIGGRNSLDYKMYYLADMRLPANYLVDLCYE